MAEHTNMNPQTNLMQITDLTDSEITQLIESLIVWEKAPNSKAFQDSLFSTMLGSLDKDPLAREREKAKTDKIFDIAKREEQMRREASVCLQAKLINIRNARLNENLA